MLAMPARPHFARYVASWSGAHDFVQSILVMPGGLVVSGGDSGVMRLHLVGERTEPRGMPTSLYGHTGAVMCLDAQRSGPWSLDGRPAEMSYPPTALFSGSVDHHACKWDLQAGAVRTATLEGHSRSVHCLTLGYEGPYAGCADVLFTGSRDHTIKLWDLRTNACEHTLHGHTGSVTCIGVHGWRLVSGGGYNRGADDDEVLSVDSTLRLWDLRTLGAPGRSTPVWTREAPSPVDVHPPHFGEEAPGDPVLSLQLMESKLLTSHGGKQWTARIWDLERPRETSSDLE